MADDDGTLLLAWRGGDADAGEALFARHLPSIARFFRNKVDGDIEELVQRTFLGCLEGHMRFSGAGSFRGYLFGIARNILFNHLRMVHRHGTPVDVDKVSLDDLSPTPSNVVADKEEMRLMLVALRRLPLAHQLIIEFAHWEEMTLAEIAEALAVPAGTAATRLRRARQLLKEQMLAMASSPELRQSITSGFETWARNLRHQR